MSATAERNFSPLVVDRSTQRRAFRRKLMNPPNFFAELKRRHVYRVAIAYGVVAWLLIQGATQVCLSCEIPNFLVRPLVPASALGLTVGLIIAWGREMTPGGL